MLTLYINGMMCANCSNKFEEKASALEGVEEIAVNYASAKVNVKIRPNYKENEVVTKLKDLCSKIEPKASLEYKPQGPLGLIDINALNNKEKEVGHNHNEGHSHSHDHTEIHNVNEKWSILKYHSKQLKTILSAIIILLLGVIYEGDPIIKFMIFLTAYLLVGKDILLASARNIARGEVFDENFLMSIATLGAFAIGEYPEGVAVMLFFNVGEMFQDMAVQKSRKSIRELMDIRPDYANIKTESSILKVSPADVKIGDIIVVKPGEKVPLDGILIKGRGQVDTSNLTGEPVPRIVKEDDIILSGYINKESTLEIRVTKEFKDSTVTKILEMVENASAKKAPTEKFITKFSRYYTPAVVIFAAGLALIPPLFLGYEFEMWIYRALVFLVVSCPCALVVSIPLGFFGGIGSASKHGILVKGGNYLEGLKNSDIVVFDKTGTLTKGKFEVQEIVTVSNLSKDELLEYAAYAEKSSNHPIANSILKAYPHEIDFKKIGYHHEVAGHGIKAEIDGKEVLAGNAKLMKGNNIEYKMQSNNKTVVHIAIDGEYKGYISIFDKLKDDAKEAVTRLRQAGVKSIGMLTGDIDQTAQEIKNELGMDFVRSELLPDQKVYELEKIMDEYKGKGKVLFVGDGINDAPVLARADIGVAMGGLGSDAAIEAADVVIMTDEPSKISEAMKIAKLTNKIVWQNIYFSLGVKALVLVLGAFGLANMWGAVFADVGVSLIAVLNAIRVIKS